MALVLLSAAAARSVRFIAQLVLLGAPLVAVGIAELLRRADPRAARAAIAGLVAVGAATAALVLPYADPKLPFGGGSSTRDLPSAAADALTRGRPTARVLAPMEASWFLLWAVPGIQVVVDGRVPFWGPDHIVRVARVLGSPEALSGLLETGEVDALVFPFASDAGQAALPELLRAPSLRVTSIDDRYALFVTDTGSPDPTGPEFSTLLPTLNPGAFLSDDLALDRARAELERLDPVWAKGFRSWATGILALRTLRRSGSAGGFRAPATEEERQAARQAARDLAVAADRFPLVPSVQAYHALAAVAACDTDAAREAIGRARLEGDNREALLAEAELALRGGDPVLAEAVVAAAAADPRGRNDPWVAGLRADLSDPPRCR